MAKKKKAKGRSIRIKAAPVVAPFLVRTDSIATASMAFYWGDPTHTTPVKTHAEAVAGANKALREDEAVRLVGIYKLVATVRPDRAPLTTVLEECH